MNSKNLIFKSSLIALFSCMLSLSLSLHAMEKDKTNQEQESECVEVKLLFMQTLLERLAYTQESNGKEQDPRLKASIATLEKLRSSAKQKGIAGWQIQCPPQKQSVCPGFSCNFEQPISDVTPVPFTEKILISSHNKLFRLDAQTQSLQTIEFTQPIARLIQSKDGSLCAVLLIPNKEKEAEIRFINSCKSTFECDTDIETQTYFRTNEYEITQEADLSSDGHFLATIENQNTANVYNLKSKKSFPIRIESCFPCFSVHFLKKNNNYQVPTEDQELLAIQSNLETHLYEVCEDKVTKLRTIDYRKKSKIDYCSRQGAWLLPGKLAVLLEEKLRIYAEKKVKKDYCSNAEKTFKIDLESNLRPCFDEFIFMEQKTDPSQICLHNLLTRETKMYSNPNEDTVFLGQSDKIAFMARDKQIMLLLKNAENREEIKKNISEKN